jgi:hypothetical protein
MIQGMNSSKLGLANFADNPLEALARKHPELKQAYDEMVEKLLMHPSVDPNNTLQVEMIKEAVLSKITQYLLMRDRIENDCKGKTLIINPQNRLRAVGREQVSPRARYHERCQAEQNYPEGPGDHPGTGAQGRGYREPQDVMGA